MIESKTDRNGRHGHRRPKYDDGEQSLVRRVHVLSSLLSVGNLINQVAEMTKDTQEARRASKNRFQGIMTIERGVV